MAEAATKLGTVDVPAEGVSGGHLLAKALENESVIATGAKPASGLASYYVSILF